MARPIPFHWESECGYQRARIHPPREFDMVVQLSDENPITPLKAFVFLFAMTQTSFSLLHRSFCMMRVSKFRLYKSLGGSLYIFWKDLAIVSPLSHPTFSKDLRFKIGSERRCWVSTPGIDSCPKSRLRIEFESVKTISYRLKCAYVCGKRD